MAEAAKDQPPSTKGAETAAKAVKAKTGPIVSSASSASLPSSTIIWAGSMVCARVSDRPLRIKVPRRSPMVLPMLCSAIPAVNITAAAVRSRERGICPFSRASCSRFSVGCSVLSCFSLSSPAMVHLTVVERLPSIRNASRSRFTKLP